MLESRVTTPLERANNEDRRLLRLHPQDNVLTAIRTLLEGERVLVDGREVTVHMPIPIGHKLAARSIASGEKVIKYGVPIGSAIRDIAAGEHVHTQNLQSDYLPTYKRGEGELHAR
jgi:altronate dehydratase small subunit